MRRPFRQVDVFTATPYLGNPLAVVLDGNGLETGETRRFARWTNLSETTFVLTGSLNASLAQWLLATGRAEAPYVAREGTALGCAGRVHVSRDDDGTIRVGGGTVTCVAGEVEL